jgi:hypothetical protein
MRIAARRGCRLRAQVAVKCRQRVCCICSGGSGSTRIAGGARNSSTERIAGIAASAIAAWPSTAFRSEVSAAIGQNALGNPA